jgi:hypothetical protein
MDLGYHRDMDELLSRIETLTRQHATPHVALPPGRRVVALRWHDPADASVFEDYPELEDVADELAAYIPLAAAVVPDDVRCVMLEREAPHRVMVFDEGFHVVAPSLEQFFAAAVLAADAPAPRTDPADPADPADKDAEAVAALSGHEQAGRWSEARVAVEALLATWKVSEVLTDLRARYAVILARLGDQAAIDKLATDHVRHLVWLAGSERPRALALQATMLARLDEAMRDDLAPLLARIREAIAALIAEPPSPVSDDDRSTALRLIGRSKTLQLTSLFKQVPALVDDPQVRAAVDALPSSPQAKEIRALVAEVRERRGSLLDDE